MEVFRKYGASAVINFPLITAGAQDFETSITFAAADTKIKKNEGASANTGSTPAHEGEGTFSLALTATEMQAARVVITVIDVTATKVWEDQAIIITTYGDASAEHAFDLDAELTNGTIWDEVLTGGTHNITNSSGRRLRALQDLGTYEGGAVWIDTVNGTAGTDDFENGTVTNPSLTIADALTIANSVGLKGFRVIPGSSITLAATIADFIFEGHDYTIALGSQNVDNTSFHDATISGTFGGQPDFQHCSVGSITGPNAALNFCGLTGTITTTSTADWHLTNCYNGAASGSLPSFDFGAGQGASDARFHMYSGGLEIQNIGTLGGDTMNLDGFGELTLNANCAGGTINIHGHFNLVDNAGGAVTIVDDANFDTTTPLPANMTQISGSAPAADDLESSALTIVRATVDTVTNSHTPTTTEFQADDVTEATADHFNGRIVIFTSGALINQATDITDYAAVGGIGQFTVTAMTEAPSNNDTFVIL